MGTQPRSGNTAQKVKHGSGVPARVDVAVAVDAPAFLQPPVMLVNVCAVTAAPVFRFAPPKGPFGNVDNLTVRGLGRSIGRNFSICTGFSQV